MILVDTSIWIDHLRARDEELVNLLTGGTVLSHPFVIGEIAHQADAASATSMLIYSPQFG